MDAIKAQQAQVIPAPSRPAFQHAHAVFLAGTTTAPDWRGALIAALSHQPVTIINPLRHDWDSSSWQEDEAFEPFREQVQWELDMQDKSGIVVVYFGPGTDAPVSLLELGLCARSDKALVVCHPDYRKRGNVQIVCRRHDITLMHSLDGLAAAVIDKLFGSDQIV